MWTIKSSTQLSRLEYFCLTQPLKFSNKYVWIFYEFFVWNLSEIQTRFIQIFIQKSYSFHTMKYLERHLQTIKKSIWKEYEMYLKYIWKVSGMYRHRFRTSKFATILIIGLLHYYIGYVHRSSVIKYLPETIKYHHSAPSRT